MYGPTDRRITQQNRRGKKYPIYLLIYLLITNLLLVTKYNTNNWDRILFCQAVALR